MSREGKDQGLLGAEEPRGWVAKLVSLGPIEFAFHLIYLYHAINWMRSVSIEPARYQLSDMAYQLPPKDWLSSYLDGYSVTCSCPDNQVDQALLTAKTGDPYQMWRATMACSLARTNEPY